MSRLHVTGGDTAVLAPPALPLGQAGQLWLIELTGARRAWPLSRALRLGRGQGCDIVLDDVTLSRTHATVIPTAGGVEVRDLDSRNGTFLDGRRVARAIASRRGVVRLGQSLCRITALLDEWQPVRAEGPLVGGARFAPVRRLISLVAPTELPVLIFGETGTGKEVVARLLHQESRRRGPFLAVNCAALPENLAESELFGHVRGAFTGADQARKGLFSTAAGGTLFLDEVGELSLPVQAKLLRVIEDGLVRPVGSERPSRVDVRILSATNRDLRHETAGGAFRSDLLARLAAVEIKTPPLREHLEDVPVLVEWLLARSGRQPAHLSADALEALLLYDWPRNVRELDGVVRAAALSGGAEVGLESLPAEIGEALVRARQPAASGHEESPALRGRVESGHEERPVLRGRGESGHEERPVLRGRGESGREERPVLRGRVESALARHRGNVRQASREAGISRGHFYRLVKAWGLDVAHYRPNEKA